MCSPPFLYPHISADDDDCSVCVDSEDGRRLETRLQAKMLATAAEAEDMSMVEVERRGAGCYGMDAAAAAYSYGNSTRSKAGAAAAMVLIHDDMNMDESTQQQQLMNHPPSIIIPPCQEASTSTTTTVLVPNAAVAASCRSYTTNYDHKPPPAPPPVDIVENNKNKKKNCSMEHIIDGDDLDMAMAATAPTIISGGGVGLDVINNLVSAPAAHHVLHEDDDDLTSTVDDLTSSSCAIIHNNNNDYMNIHHHHLPPSINSSPTSSLLMAAAAAAAAQRPPAPSSSSSSSTSHESLLDLRSCCSFPNRFGSTNSKIPASSAACGLAPPSSIPAPSATNIHNNNDIILDRLDMDHVNLTNNYTCGSKLVLCQTLPPHQQQTKINDYSAAAAAAAGSMMINSGIENNHNHSHGLAKMSTIIPSDLNRHQHLHEEQRSNYVDMNIADILYEYGVEAANMIAMRQQLSLQPNNNDNNYNYYYCTAEEPKGVDILCGEQQPSIVAIQDFCKYTKEEKQKRIERYRQKRQERNFNKTIKLENHWV